jgi:hypothetical protein
MEFGNASGRLFQRRTLDTSAAGMKEIIEVSIPEYIESMPDSSCAEACLWSWRGHLSSHADTRSRCTPFMATGSDVIPEKISKCAKP